MKKVCGFALIFFSLGMLCACLLNGPAEKTLLILGFMTAGVLLFRSPCSCGK
ncbi:MAG: hypothetical protein IJI25_03190 [Eubacterium sp.]|nr:hypothetical protein [Eubacterium sp.]